jgi:BirA family biotin operon repressor/biotin-[acetyl-CoA-carboxylase] ligase
MGRLLQIAEIEPDLSTRRIGTRFHYLSEIDSTNSYAHNLAREGAQEGEVIVAERQTHGRGRLGRSWVSPPYVNLYFSVILRPRLLPRDVPQITLMAAVALTEALTPFAAVAPTIKWPNDILIQGKKLAGILTESSCEAGRVEFVILGAGINVNTSLESLPAPIHERATSLSAVNGKQISREKLFKRLIQDLDRCYGELEQSGFESLAARWEAHFGLRGKKVKVEMVDQSFCGTAMGLDRDGALIVEDEKKVVQRVIAADVIPLEEG